QKLWRGEDDLIGAEADRAPPVVRHGDDLDPALSAAAFKAAAATTLNTGTTAPDAVTNTTALVACRAAPLLKIPRAYVGDGQAEADARARLLVEVSDESPVAFGPGDERLRLRAGPAHARGEVEESGPRARLLRPQPVVVAARVVNEPAQARRSEAARVHPLGHREAVERRRLRVVRAVSDGDREGAPARGVAPAGPSVNLRVEGPELARVLFRLARAQVEALVPAPSVEDPLFGVAADELLGDDRLAFGVRAFEHAQLVEQTDERAILLERRGQVVCAPGVRHDAVRVAGARRPARRGFEFEQHEVFKPGLQKSPRRGEARDAAADYHDPRALPSPGRRFGAQPVAYQVAYPVRRADDL